MRVIKCNFMVEINEGHRILLILVPLTVPTRNLHICTRILLLNLHFLAILFKFTALRHSMLT